jgi:hypothetical protein
MKRVPLLTLLALSAMATAASAQSLSFGVRAGANYASATTGSETTLASKPSAIYGGFVELAIVPPFVFQAGIQYAERHTTVSTTTPGLPTPADTAYNMNYFEIPVTLKMTFGSPKFQFYGLAGANLGTLMKAARSSSTPGGPADSVDIKASLDKSTVAVELGGGVGIEVASHTSVVLDARYNMGLKDINTSGEAMLATGACKPRDLRITAGLVFRIGR